MALTHDQMNQILITGHKVHMSFTKQKQKHKIKYSNQYTVYCNFQEFLKLYLLF